VVRQLRHQVGFRLERFLCCLAKIVQHDLDGDRTVESQLVVLEDIS